MQNANGVDTNQAGSPWPVASRVPSALRKTLLRQVLALAVEDLDLPGVRIGDQPGVGQAAGGQRVGRPGQVGADVQVPGDASPPLASASRRDTKAVASPLVGLRDDQVLLAALAAEPQRQQARGRAARAPLPGRCR